MARLAKSETARDRAVATLFSPDPETGNRADAIAHMARQSRQFMAVAKSAPDDSLLAWLAATQCRDEHQCDEDAAIDHVLRLESDNMAAWLLAADRAVEQDNEAEADALLQRAANAPRMDFHWRDQALLVINGLSPLPVPSCEPVSDLLGATIGASGPVKPADLVAVVATASAAAMLMPLGVSRLCPSSGSIPSARVAACRAIFARMAHGDELATQAIGVERMAAWATSTTEQAKWRERLRDHLWLQQEGWKLFRPGYTRMMLEHGEVPFLAALLEEQRRWPAPPGWLPENPFQRARLEDSSG